MTMAPLRFKNKQLPFPCIFLLVSVHMYIRFLHGQVHWFLAQSELFHQDHLAALMAAAW